ncbi:MAG: hypothetical protein WC076_01085 [Terrimicrobiaceae bacterium]|nr:hypothetical protein [Terrimicrobiaceae bacterium]
MKSILTLLSVACLATIGFTGCSSTCAKGTPKACLMTKKPCPAKTSCCATPPAACPMKKKPANTPQ